MSPSFLHASGRLALALRVLGFFLASGSIVVGGCAKQDESVSSSKSSASELISKQALSLKRLNIAKTEYYDKEMEILGYLRVDDYYNWGYVDAHRTHYSFKLHDKHYEAVQVYFRKEVSTNLFDALINTDKIPVKIRAVAYRNKQDDDSSRILFEGISLEVLQ